MLIYTRDGHMSVQLIYPKSSGALSNEYVEKEYEASFGSSDINEATHTVTHHLQGSKTRDEARSASDGAHMKTLHGKNTEREKT
jgi:hypothetical protein